MWTFWKVIMCGERLADGTSVVVWLEDPDCTTSVSVWKAVEDVDFKMIINNSIHLSDSLGKTLALTLAFNKPLPF